MKNADRNAIRSGCTEGGTFVEVLAVKASTVYVGPEEDGAVDAAIRVGGYVGEVTLIRDSNGDLDTWGDDRSLWASQEILSLLELCDEDGDDTMATTIVGLVQAASRGR